MHLAEDFVTVGDELGVRVTVRWAAKDLTLKVLLGRVLLVPSLMLGLSVTSASPSVSSDPEGNNEEEVGELVASVSSTLGEFSLLRLVFFFLSEDRLSTGEIDATKSFLLETGVTFWLFRELADSVRP